MVYEKDSPCSPKLMGEVGKTGIGKHFQGKVLIVLDFEVPSTGGSQIVILGA